MSRALRAASIAALLIVEAVLLAVQIFAPTPTPHGISGYIFESDWATQVPVNTAYGINDTVSGDYVRGITTIDVPDL